jgi:hypothetical protein
VIEEDEEKRRALYGLISKYYPAMTAGKEYRPITDQELKRTNVYAIATLAPLRKQCGSRVGSARCAVEQLAG